VAGVEKDRDRGRARGGVLFLIGHELVRGWLEKTGEEKKKKKNKKEKSNMGGVGRHGGFYFTASTGGD